MVFILSFIIYLCLGYLVYTWKSVRGSLPSNWAYLKLADQRFILIAIVLLWFPILIGEKIKRILEKRRKK